MIILGNEVEDNVTGFRGIAVTRLECLNGTMQYGVKPRAAARRRMLDVEYIDAGQLVLLGPGVTDQPIQVMAVEAMQAGTTEV